MGKYDDLIGGGHIEIDVFSVLEEQNKEALDRIELAEKLYTLVEEDIRHRQSHIFKNELWAKSDIEYYRQFLRSLEEYLDHIKGT